MSVKVTSDMIRPFSGEGDVVAWLKKIQLVAKLQKITDLASFLPLYLEGEAIGSSSSRGIVLQEIVFLPLQFIFTQVAIVE